MLKLKIDISGKTEGDLGIALEEVQRLISEGYTVGADRNDSGRYYFERFGEDEVEIEIEIEIEGQ